MQVCVFKRRDRLQRFFQKDPRIPVVLDLAASWVGAVDDLLPSSPPSSCELAADLLFALKRPQQP